MKFDLTLSMLYSVMVALLLTSMAEAKGANSTFHVSAKNGNDVSGDGSELKPFLTIRKAVERFYSNNASAEIIIHEGVYTETKPIWLRRISSQPIQWPLLIRGADSEEVWIDGSKAIIHNATKYADIADTWAISTNWNLQRPPEIWDATIKIRLKRAICIEAMKTTSFSSFMLNNQTLLVHLSSGNLLSDYDFHMGSISSKEYSFVCYFLVHRDSVTFRNLKFRNFFDEINASPIVFGGNFVSIPSQYVLHGVVEDCYIENSFHGLWIYGSTNGTILRRNTIIDCHCGIFVQGTNSTIDRNVISNDSPSYFQDNDHERYNAGIWIYWDARNGVYTNNLVRGFDIGIFIKTYPGETIWENNTLIAIPDIYQYTITSSGLYVVFLAKGIGYKQIIKSNVFYGYRRNGIGYESDPISGTESEISGNVFWEHPNAKSVDLLYFGKWAGLIKMKNNVIADPLFVDIANNDYRLLPNSPALNVNGTGIPAGSLGLTPSAVTGTPFISSLTCLCTWGKFWNQIFCDYSVPTIRQFSTRITNFTVKIIVNSYYPLSNLRITVGNNSPYVIPYDSSIPIYLPNGIGYYKIGFEAQNNKGAWGSQEFIYVEYVNDIQLTENPVVIKNQFGMLVQWKVSHHSICELQVKNSSGMWKTVQRSYFLQNWDSSPQDWVHLDYSIPLLTTGDSGSLIQSRLYLWDWTDHDTYITLENTTLEGNTKTLFVGMEGSDDNSNYGATFSKPFKTIQFALRFALPGDTIMILPGYYPEHIIISHAGTIENPLTIKAMFSGTVIIDGKGSAYTILGYNVVGLILQGLKIRGFITAGVHLFGSNFRLTEMDLLGNFYLSAESGQGTGVYISGSNSEVDHCIIRRSRTGIYIYNSANVNIHHNTLVVADVTVVRLVGNITGTSFTYNDVHLWEDQLFNLGVDQKVLDNHFTSDYNNMGTVYSDKGNADINLTYWSKRQSFWGSREFAVFATSFKGSAISYTWSQWKSLTGKDSHSIFINPLWIDDAIGNFYLKDNSPNILPNGNYIGCCGLYSSYSGPRPFVVITNPLTAQEFYNNENIDFSVSSMIPSGFTISSYSILVDEKVVSSSQTFQTQITLATKINIPGTYRITAQSCTTLGSCGNSNSIVLTIKDSHTCGDNFCSSDETCTSCPQDGCCEQTSESSILKIIFPIILTVVSMLC